MNATLDPVALRQVAPQSRDTMAESHANLPLRLKRTRNGERDLVPVGGLLAQLFLACFGQGVVLRTSIVFGRLP